MKSLEFHLVISLGKTSSLSEKPSEGTRGGRPLCHGWETFLRNTPTSTRARNADRGHQRTRLQSCSQSPGRCSACATQTSSEETRPLQDHISISLGISLTVAPSHPCVQPHLHAGMSRRNGKMRTTACRSWHQVRRRGPGGPQAHRGYPHGWPRPGPQCMASQGAGPQAPHCPCCTWPCAEPACGLSPPPVPGCQPCSDLSTRPASTRPGGGRAASPDEDL